MFVDHPLVRREALEDRAYQRAITERCVERSTLVILPTGMGKTAIAARAIAEILRTRGGKVLFLAPTKPLVEQHAAYLKRVLVVESVAVFTGELPPEDRELLWRESKIVCSTPQVIENDLRAGRFDLSGVTLAVFDEAHRAVGDYAYVDVAAHYDGLVLAMTASPGSSRDKLLDVFRNLRIDVGHHEIRTPLDPDVMEYMHPIAVERVVVDVPDNARPVIARLRALYETQVEEMKRRGWISAPRPTVRDLLALGNAVRARLDAGEGPREPMLYQILSKQAIAVKVNHAVELAETQGLAAVRGYFERLERDKGTRANRTLLKDRTFQEAVALVRGATGDHPKLRKAVEVVVEQFHRQPESRVMVFANYRDTVDLLVRALSTAEGVRPARFVGQAAREEAEGLTQKEQVALLDRFRAGEVNCLVSTSIGEEGLDVPSTDLVVFHEPVPSEIRTIQRRGRTGRGRAGRTVLLVTRDTRDEAYFYSARRKERRMHEELDRLRDELRQLKLQVASGEEHPPEAAEARPKKAGQASLQDFSP